MAKKVFKTSFSLIGISAKASVLIPMNIGIATIMVGTLIVTMYAGTKL